MGLAGELDATPIGFESLTEKIDATTVPARARGRKGGRPALLPEKAAAIQVMVASDRPVTGLCKVLWVERSSLYGCASGLTIANVDAHSPIPDAGGIVGTHRRNAVSLSGCRLSSTPARMAFRLNRGKRLLKWRSCHACRLAGSSRPSPDLQRCPMSAAVARYHCPPITLRAPAAQTGASSR